MLLLSALVCVVLVACGSDDGGDPSTDPTDVVDTDTGATDTGADAEPDTTGHDVDTGIDTTDVEPADADTADDVDVLDCSDACTPDATRCDGSVPELCVATDACPAWQAQADCGDDDRVCIDGACFASTCEDEVLGGDETDVDCGGSACPACDADATCSVDGDCASGVCTDDLCVAATCSDEVMNGDESAVDCGGSCDPCDDGVACGTAGDCASGFCEEEGLCRAASCGNDALDDGEVGVDCGGLLCAGCAIGVECYTNSDCESGKCQAGFCRPAHCADGEWNADEVFTDCGGACGGCPIGTACNAGGACDTGVCGEDRTCAAPTCDDRVANGDETDIDCGGSCEQCLDGEGCLEDGDCTSGVCAEVGACAPPECGDGVLQDDEVCDDGDENSDELADACRTSCEPAACGDAVVDTGEACDDGDALDTNACLADCTVAFCGDGYVRVGVEECDDANDVDTDACRNDCTAAFCGDGVVQDGVEECDDANDVDADGCTDCVIDTCPDEELTLGGVDGLIGPAVVSADTCALTNDDAAPRCSESSTGGDFSFTYRAPADGLYAFTTSNPTTDFDTVLYTRDGCGGDVLRCVDDVSPEDASSTLANVALTRADVIQLHVTGAGDECGAFAVDVSARYCGDGVVDEDLGEPCDDGNTSDTDACVRHCVVARCGDGLVQDGVEECDLGRLNNSDTAPDTCRSDCTDPRCGDGVVDSGEPCDDGNLVDDDTCSNACVVATCDDGIQNGGEFDVDCGGPCSDRCVQSFSGVRREIPFDRLNGWQVCATLPGNRISGESVTNLCGEGADNPWVMWSCGADGVGELEVSAQGFIDDIWFLNDNYGRSHVTNGVRWGGMTNQNVGYADATVATTGRSLGSGCGDGDVSDLYQSLAMCARHSVSSDLRYITRCGNLAPSTESYLYVFRRVTTEDTTLCGNGVLDPGETCDDGDGDPFNACPNTCIAPAD